MGKMYDEIDGGMKDFIGRQHVFFVGTAPDSPGRPPQPLAQGAGHVPHPRAELGGLPRPDRQRDRDGRPPPGERADHHHVLRLRGPTADRPPLRPGRVVEPGDPEWDGLIAGFPEYPGVRSVVVMDVERVADSCGFAVPLYEYKGERSQLIDYAEQQGAGGPGGVQGRRRTGRASTGSPGSGRPGARGDDAGDPAVRVEDAEGEEGLGHARRLFRAFAAEYAASIAEIFCFQGFEAELAGLPGRYAPPSGCLLLAMERGHPRRVRGDAGPGRRHLRDEAALRRARVPGPGRREAAGRGGRPAGPSGPATGGWCSTRLPEMAGAIALYRRHGFVETRPLLGQPDRADNLPGETALGPEGLRPMSIRRGRR